MDEITLELNSPITEKQWDEITDVDFDHTDIIWFYTKNGKYVEFVKRKTGRWIPVTNGRGGYECDQCHNYAPAYQTGADYLTNFCPCCGADMRGEQNG